MERNAITRWAAVPVMLLLLTLRAHAQDVPSPLVLATPARAPQQPDTTPTRVANPATMAANALVLGFLESWIAGRADKQVHEFQESTQAVEWGDLAGGILSCVGIPQGQKCRTVIKFNGNEDDLAGKLHEAGASQAVVVVLLQQFDGQRYRARATLREMELTPKAPKIHRMFTAISNSDTPDEVTHEAHGDSAKVRNYWTAGTSPLLEKEARASLSELKDMLDILYAAVPDEHGSPNGWKDLKPISEFEASGRARCHGLQCLTTRAFADHGDHIWIASSESLRGQGWILISLDRNAALHNAGIIMQSLPAL